MFCKQTVDNFLEASQNKRIVLWGAGKFVEEIVEKYNNVECIRDSDSEKWGTKCCYHNPQDYWRIYELICEFVPDYKFAVRHHQNNHLDTVLYAWEEN